MVAEESHAEPPDPEMGPLSQALAGNQVVPGEPADMEAPSDTAVHNDVIDDGSEVIDVNADGQADFNPDKRSSLGDMREVGVHGQLVGVLTMGATDKDAKPGEFTDLLVVDIRHAPEVPTVAGRRRRPFDDMPDLTVDGDFLLMAGPDSRPARDASHPGAVKTLKKGRAVELGRDTPVSDRFDFSEAVSRKHCSIEYDEAGNIVVKNHNPTYGTQLTVGRKEGR